MSVYEYRCEVRRVVDGDTVDVDIDLGFGTWLMNRRIRIVGIDTPECRTRDAEEKRFGLMAKEFVTYMLGDECILYCEKWERGKFGRILGDLSVGDDEHGSMWLTDCLLQNNLAVVYNGQSKQSIEESHLRNRTILHERDYQLKYDFEREDFEDDLEL